MTLCGYLTYIHLTTIKHQLPDFPGGSDGKESTYSSGDPGSIPGPTLLDHCRALDRALCVIQQLSTSYLFYTR